MYVFLPAKKQKIKALPISLRDNYNCCKGIHITKHSISSQMHIASPSSGLIYKSILQQ